MASAISDGMSRRRVVAQWMWLIASSLRRPGACCRSSRKNCSSSKVGYSGEQSRRDTAKAPQALAQVADVSQALAAEPAAQEAGHEGVAGAEHVVDLDREALADDAVLEIVADRPVIDDAAHRAALQHDGRRRQRADRLQRGQHVVGAGGDHDLLLGADDQIADRAAPSCSLRRDAVGLHIALEARGMAGQAPEVRPVVDVEHDLAAVRLGDADRLALRGVGVGAREMRAGDDDRARRGDEGLVDVVLGVSAMSAQSVR